MDGQLDPVSERRGEAKSLGKAYLAAPRRCTMGREGGIGKRASVLERARLRVVSRKRLRHRAAGYYIRRGKTMVKNFDHVTIVVRDVERAKEFFRLLGFEHDHTVI